MANNAPAPGANDRRAFEAFRAANPNGLIGIDDGFVCMIEDHADPDGNMFRLEYRSTPDGQHATAWCHYSPWCDQGSMTEPHTTHGGLICVGPHAHNPSVKSSPYDVDFVLKRARYWCTAVTVFHETGSFPG
jgi:hypothetical protein